MKPHEIDAASRDLLTGLEHLLTEQSPPPSPDLAHAAALLREDPIRAAHLWHSGDGQQVTGPDVADHLEAALAILRREGWTKGRFMTEGRCTQAALQDATTAKAGSEATAYVARSVMRWLLHARGTDVDTITYNDDRHRTQSEIETLFVQAAAFARHYGPASSSKR